VVLCFGILFINETHHAGFVCVNLIIEIIQLILRIELVRLKGFCAIMHGCGYV
jgi:hypothetical protein